MYLIVVSFIAGMLTVLTPCSFTLLPVILSSGLEETKSKRRPYIIIASLAISVFVFSILLKASTLLIQIPLEFWNIVSGVLILILGLSFVFPDFFSNLLSKNFLTKKSEEQLGIRSKQNGTLSAIMSGLALGPIFSGCSPTYLLIVSVLLPADFLTGTIYLVFYCLGLCAILLLVIFGGRTLLNRLKWAVNPNGTFRMILGLILVVLGILIAFGVHKQIESSLLNADFSRSIINLESGLLK